MRLLLDTHGFLWFVENSRRLSVSSRALIEDRTSQVFLSMASVWEMAIKVSHGKLRLTQPIEVLVPHQASLNQIALLPITLDHLWLVAKLPLHHRDPFDRLLVAQAQVEGMSIVSVDRALDAYGITRLW